MDLIIAPFNLFIWLLTLTHPHFAGTIPVLYLEIKYLAVRKHNLIPVLLLVFLCIAKHLIFLCLSCIWIFYCFFAIKATPSPI